MNKVVVITGASRGIGKAIALKFAKNQYDVVINYRGSEDKAKQVQQECETYGVNTMIYQGDVSSLDEMNLMMKAINDKFGRIDVLVNNSGITKDNLLLKMTGEAFDDVIDVNLKGTFNTIKAVSRIMMKQRQGVIINMASVVGITGNIGQANYAASKAGVIALTKSTAKEFALREIRVNAIAPGFVETEWQKEKPKQIRENICAKTALKRFADVDEIAEAVKFCIKNQFVNGSIIEVSGGYNFK